MNRHRYRGTARVAILAALGLAIAGCSTVQDTADPGPGDLAPTSGSPSTGTTAPAATGAATDAAGSPTGTPDTDAGPDANATAVGSGSRICSADGDSVMVVNRGSMSCENAKALLDEYYRLARTGQFGNAGIATVRGLSCASPTAVSAFVQGVATRCHGPQDDIIVRPPAPEVPGVQDAVRDYMDVLEMDQMTHMVSESGSSFCWIRPDYPRGVVSCTSTLLADQPVVTTDGFGKAQANNTVTMGNSGRASRVFQMHVPTRGNTAPIKTIEVGHTVVSGGIACTAESADRLSCANADGGWLAVEPGALLTER